MVAHGVSLGRHARDQLGAFFRLFAHHEEGGVRAALFQRIQQRRRVFGWSVIKGESDHFGIPPFRNGDAAGRRLQNHQRVHRADALGIVHIGGCLLRRVQCALSGGGL